MRFSEIHALVPYITEGELHSVTTELHPTVRVRQPGRHKNETSPAGGDMVVEVNCASAQWDWKQFTHGDIFKDIETKTIFDQEFMRSRGIVDLARVVKEDAGIRSATPYNALLLPGLRYNTLLRASQALSVAEHRRYHQYESGGGGRYLPLRFAIGIVYGYWTASDAVRVQRRGVHGLRDLTKQFGNPPTVKAVLDGAKSAVS